MSLSLHGAVIYFAEIPLETTLSDNRLFVVSVRRLDLEHG